MRKIAIVLFCIFIVVTGVWFYFFETYPLSSPFKSAEYFLEHLQEPHNSFNQYVLGFLPYWQLDTIQYLKPNELSEVNYFSLNVGTDGHLLKVTNGQTDPGWNGWIQQSTKDFITKSQIMGAKTTITIAAQDNATINAVLNSNTAQQNLISDILAQVSQRKLNGVNIDFEYTGTPANVYQQEFTYFSEKLASQLKNENPRATLALSIMPLSGEQTGLFDFSKLMSVYDYFIGMSYDYYGQNSEIAGPDAPMNGFKQGKYFFDVTTTYTDFLKYIPKDKILMGIPYYGWEWAVENGPTINSETFPTDSSNGYAAVMSYARFRQDTDINQNQCQWDTLSEETWCWFTDKTTGIDHQVWPMDNRAIQVRFDYAKQENFAGIAIWTLGLDKNYPDLWDMLQKTF